MKILLHWCSDSNMYESKMCSVSVRLCYTLYQQEWVWMNLNRSVTIPLSLQELNTKPDNVILTSMYPRNELVSELDSQSMVQLQLVPSGVLLVRMKTVRSLALYPHSWAFPTSTSITYTVLHAVSNQNMEGSTYLARSAMVLSHWFSTSALYHTQCIGWYCTHIPFYMYILKYECCMSYVYNWRLRLRWETNAANL